MSFSKKTSFRPSKNVMSGCSICFENSPGVVTVARIVSPGWVSLCWNVRDGVAVAIEISRIMENR